MQNGIPKIPKRALYITLTDLQLTPRQMGRVREELRKFTSNLASQHPAQGWRELPVHRQGARVEKFPDEGGVGRHKIGQKLGRHNFFRFIAKALNSSLY